jgi:hypothetical protein
MKKIQKNLSSVAQVFIKTRHVPKLKQVWMCSDWLSNKQQQVMSKQNQIHKA